MRYTNIINNPQPTLNNELHYKTHTLFDTITHAIHTNISAIPTTMNQKTNSIQPVPPRPQSIENRAHGIEKLLLKTQESEDFDSEMNLVKMNTKKYHVFAPMGRFQLESIYLYFPPSWKFKILKTNNYNNQ